MTNTIAISLGLLSLFFLASIPSVFASAAAIVNTTNGPVLGEVITLNTNKTLVQYLGIPFAKANRFEAPESPKPWTATLSATKFGPSCPQNRPNIVVKSTDSTSEDCLSINVFLPGSKAERNALLPVMVWIYGGGFLIGSSAYHIYTGAYLATEGDVAVVTLNYRLGVLGFLSTGTKDLPGNFGLLDQVKALQWVQENIERFGGDPQKVTIFGQSAGSASVALHMLSPMSFGLYHQVILQSGTAATTFAGMENKTAIEVATTLGNILGCSTTGLKHCLTSKSVSEILEAQENISLTAAAGSQFLPVADYHFLNDLPLKLLVKGEFNQTVPAIIGVTKNEGGFFVLPMKGLTTGIPGIDKGLNKAMFDNLVKHNNTFVYNQTQKVLETVIFEYTDWTNETNPLVVRQMYMDVITEALFKAPAVRSAQAFVKNKMKTFFYCFDHFNDTLFHLPPWVGVMHGSGLPYVFGDPFRYYNSSLPSSQEGVEMKFSKQIMTLWSDFAKNGNPTSNQSVWPEYTLQDEQYISLSPSSSVQKNMLPEKMAFWNSLVPSLAEPSGPVNPPTTPMTSATPAPTADKEAIVDKGTERALIAVVVVFGVLLVVLLVVLGVVIWRMRRKQGNAVYEPAPTT